MCKNCLHDYLIHRFFFCGRYLFSKSPEKSFFLSDGGMRDRDITFRDQMDLVCCFFGCVVKFPAREANRRAGEGSRFRNECFFFFCLSRLSTLRFFFSRSIAHTHTNRKVRRDSERLLGTCVKTLYIYRIEFSKFRNSRH